MRTHTVTLRAGVCWGPTWLLPSWVLFQFDADGLKQSEEDYEIRFRSEGEPQHCLTLSLRSAGRLTAISEASAVWIESLLSASANPLLHLINHELGQTQSHNTLQRNWKERGKMCLSKQNPPWGCFSHNQFAPVIIGHVEQMFHKDRKMYSFHLLG